MRSAIPKGHRALVSMATLALLAATTPANARQDEAPVTIENIRVGLSEDPDDASYKLGTWTPVRIDLQGGPQPFSGMLRLTVPDDGGVPSTVVRRVEVPARAGASFLCYARPGDSYAPFQVEVLDDRQRRRDRASEDSAEWLDPEHLVIAVAGNPGGVDLLPAMSEFQIENALQATRLRVSRLRIPEGIPDRWYGYDAVEALVLDLNDPDALAAFQDFRNLPLKRWVRNGGHLVLAGGFDRWQVVEDEDSVLRDLLPALPSGRTETADLGAIESFTGSNTPITTAERAVSVTTFEPIPERGAQILLDDRSVGGPLIVRGHYGLGRVTVVGLSVDQRPFVDWPDRDDFWVEVLDLAGRPPTEAASTGAFYNEEVRDLSSLLHRSMEQFEGVRLVPFGWVAFFVFLYILLIGPGDYFFLKKVVGRMELTWITFPLIVAVVSGLAYAAAYAVKGTDLRINRVDVVDVDQSFGDGERFLCRGSSFATLFSPRNRDYTIAALPLPLDADPSATADSPDPSRVDETLMTWFGTAEPRFGGMGRSGGMPLTASGYSYQSFGDERSSEPPERMVGVRVPIWTTKALVGTWFDDAPRVVEAELRDLGANRLSGTLTNRLNRPLNGVVIAFGGDVYLLDDRPIAPGETVRVDSAANRNLNGYLEDLDKDVGRLGVFRPDVEAGPLRSKVVRALSFARAGRRRGALKANIVLDDLDLSSQLDLGRPILLADLEGPASALLLDGAPAEAAKQSQTTVLRVLLPAPDRD